MKAKLIETLYIKNVTGALYTVNYNENTLSVSVSVNAAWNSEYASEKRIICLGVRHSDFKTCGLIRTNTLIYWEKGNNNIIAP